MAVTANLAADSANIVTTTDMGWMQTVILSIVQGLTEFLPVSSSGHMRIVSQLVWGEDAGASFTAVIQLGTELAVLVFFAKDIWVILTAWFAGVFDKTKRDNLNYRMGWMVIAATIPVGIIGFVFKDVIRDNLRSLWITATVLILFSFVFIFAEKIGTRTRTYEKLTMKDALIMGFAQCLALIPASPAPVPRSPPVSSSTWTVRSPPGSPSCWPFQRYSPRVCSVCPTLSTPRPDRPPPGPSSSSAPPLPSCWVTSPSPGC